MAQQLADLGQGGASAYQLCRQAVPKDVRSHARGFNARSRQSCGRYKGHVRSGRKANMRRSLPQEYALTLGPRSAAVKIIGDGRTDVGRQRHPSPLPTLAMNRQLTRLPVDIPKTQRRHFRGAWAKTGKQQEDCIIAPPECRRSIHCAEDLFDLCRR